MHKLAQKLFKAKEYARLEYVLNFFVRLTAHQDSHSSLLHLLGFVTDIILLADPQKHYPKGVRFQALLIIRNLSYLKESKAFLLNDGT